MPNEKLYSKHKEAKDENEKTINYDFVYFPPLFTSTKFLHIFPAFFIFRELSIYVYSSSKRFSSQMIQKMKRNNIIEFLRGLLNLSRNGNPSIIIFMYSSLFRFVQIPRAARNLPSERNEQITI